MATYDTKLGKLHVERSQKENALNLGVESKLGSGFVSVPFGREDLLHAASLLGAALALRGLTRKTHGVERAQRDVLRRQEQSRRSLDFGKAGGFGGGKRGRRKRR